MVPDVADKRALCMARVQLCGSACGCVGLQEAAWSMGACAFVARLVGQPCMHHVVANDSRAGTYRGRICICMGS
eukprot:354633-Chlamydomonas_euryale.AAC.10